VTLNGSKRPLDAPRRPRGRCRVCRRSCALTRRENVWHHLARCAAGPYDGLRCRGAGLPPLGHPGRTPDPSPRQIVVADRELLAPAHPDGTVYLLHLDEPFGHAKHYTGWASDLHGRLAHHGGPSGANLLWHVAKAGGTWTLARTWAGDRNLERRLKAHGATRRCPICRPDLAEQLLDSIG
jgi:hypothetical protein